MATNNRASQAKRSRERAKQEKQAVKRADREVRKEQKKVDGDNPDFNSDEDPDLAGIVPGPQAPIEY
jgi:hypothetical protein